MANDAQLLSEKALRYLRVHDSISYAIVYADSALEIAKKDDYHLLCDIYRTKGNAYYLTYNLPEAINHYEKSLLYAERLNDSVLIFKSYTNLGNAYHKTDDYDKSLEYSLKAVNYFNFQKDDSLYIAKLYNNIGLAYYNLDSFALGEKYLLDALEIKKNKNDLSSIASTYSNLGNLMTELQGWDRAETYFAEALNYASDVYGKILIMSNSSKIFHHKKQYGKAITELKKALEIAEKTEYYGLLKPIYEELTLNYEELGDHENANLYLNKLILIIDKVAQSEIENKTNQVLTELDNLKVKHKLELMHEEKLNTSKFFQMSSIFAGIIFSVILVFVLLLYRKSNQLKKSNLQLQKYLDAETEKVQNTEQLLQNVIEDKIETETNLERNLLQSEQKFSDIANILPVGIYITDNTGATIFINQYINNLLITPSNKFNMFDYLSNNRGQDFINEQLTNKESFQVVSTVNINGNIKIINNTAIKANQSEDNYYIYGVLEDITEKENSNINLNKMNHELMQIREKLEEANKLKQIILGNLSHELRTPLNGILGFARITLSEFEDNIYEIDNIKNIIFSAERLHSTLNSLLFLNELESENYKLQIEDINLNNFVNILQFKYIHSLNDNNLQLVIHNSEDIITAKADEYCLQNITFQLIDNAVKYTREGCVTITTGKSIINNKSFSFIKIADTGVGIDSIKMEQIFEPFRQGSEGIARNFEGVGIGLTIVKKMVELLNGQIQVKSKLGVGSEFTIFLPSSIN